MIRNNSLLFFTGVIFLSLLSWHCTKIDTTDLGGGLIPAVDNVNTFDTTFSVTANNLDTVSLGNACVKIYPTDEHALGYISNDPLFGTTKATIYTELKPASFPFTFQGLKTSDRTIDSVVLVLYYKRTYGDTTLQQSVTVHEISGTFNPDSSSCSSYPFNIPVLGSATYRPERLKDSVKVTGDTSSNQLRIKLSSSFGQTLLSARDTIKTDSVFKEILKGFAIVPDPIGNALTYYSITDTRTKLAIYYKYKRPALSDTSDIKYFSLYPTDHSANQIVRSRAGAEISTRANTNNPAGDQFIYIQTSPGSYAQVKIPGITGWPNRIIHRAELILDQVPTTPLDAMLTPPPFLFLDMKDSINHPIPCDFTVVSGLPDISTYGGYRTAVTIGGQSVARYTFNISRYVQKIVTGQKTFPTLRVWAPTYVTTRFPYVDDCNVGINPLLFAMNNVAQGRVKLYGGKYDRTTSPNSIRLRIIYSKL